MIIRISILISTFLLFACESEQAEYQTSENEEIENECEKLKFEKSYSKDITVSCDYLKCEADWKYRLRIFYKNEEIYTADTLLEYEFNEYDFQTYRKDSLYEYILVERNDRPLRNKVDVFRISNKQIDSTFVLEFSDDKNKKIDWPNG